jgi:hypothetical protein
VEDPWPVIDFLLPFGRHFIRLPAVEDFVNLIFSILADQEVQGVRF